MFTSVPALENVLWRRKYFLSIRTCEIYFLGDSLKKHTEWSCFFKESRACRQKCTLGEFKNQVKFMISSPQWKCISQTRLNLIQANIEPTQVRRNLMSNLVKTQGTHFQWQILMWISPKGQKNSCECTWILTNSKINATFVTSGFHWTDGSIWYDFSGGELGEDSFVLCAHKEDHAVQVMSAGSWPYFLPSSDSCRLV